MSKEKTSMPIYTGKSKDGSDAKIFKGVYMNPENKKEWSNRPYPRRSVRRRGRKKKRFSYTK